MKKSVLTLAAITVVALTSCTKERTCKCVDTNSGVEVHEYKITGTKKNAKAACDTYDGGSIDCSLGD